MMQFGPLELFDHYNFEISKIQDGGDAFKVSITNKHA